MSLAQPVVEPRLDAFQLAARVAHGGMATIFAGTRNGERVAVKLLHPHLAEDPHIHRMFLHEAQLAARLVHDNVVRVLDHGEHPEHGAFILMELLDGGDLAGLLKAAGRERRQLPAGVALRLAVDLCRGLEAAHTLRAEDGSPLRLIHRDVSPHNLMVSTDGVGRLTDFGIAKSDERYTMTRPGQLKGKLAYMAPEQLAHEDGLDHRVDIFAAGVVLWEALLGRRLFKGEDEISVINKVLLEKVPPPSTYDETLAPLDAVVLRALARERDDRWPTAAAFADAIEAAAPAIGGLASRADVASIVKELLSVELRERAAKLEQSSLTPSGVRSGSQPSVTRTAPPVRRSPWALPLIGALVVIAAGTGAAITWLTRPAVPVAAAPAREATEPTPAPAAPPQRATAAEAPAPAAIEAAPAVAAVPQEELPSSRRRPGRRARPGAAPEAAPAPSPAPAATPPRASAAPRDDLYPNPFRD